MSKEDDALKSAQRAMYEDAFARKLPLFGLVCEALQGTAEKREVLLELKKMLEERDATWSALYRKVVEALDNKDTI